ncbi:DUF3485 domain-containing protein [Pseudomonas sp. IT-P253]|uniref:hypothetical protein n=1 Tax=Pseudomonas sp. IT-P253 TaxID=3026455 RepID=UPI0039DFA273
MMLRKRLLFLVGVMFFYYCSAGVSLAEDMVCGKLNGHVIEVSRKYSAFWPEYEGESSWGQGFIHNKKGCDANLESWSMVMTWPEMLPADHATYFVQALRFEGVDITLKPLRRPNNDMSYLLDFFLWETPGQWKEYVIFDESLGLLYVDGKDRVFAEGLNRYYWQNSGGEVSIVFECLWLPKENRLYTCEGAYVLQEIDTLVRFRFTPEKMKEWKAVVGAIRKFVLDKVK